MPEIDRSIGHKPGGTEWGKDGARTYASTKHGPDGAQFLDLIFTSQIRNLASGKRVIDIGCGAGPWSIYAAKEGGAERVFAIDFQPGMVQQATTDVLNSGLKKQIAVEQADAAELPASDSKFPLALSINVGCNLPNASTIEHEWLPGAQRAVGFNAHFAEMARVLESDGKAIVTAPTSFDVVFTNGNRPKEEVLKDTQQRLDAIGNSKDPDVIKAEINKLDDVYRASFHWENDKLALVTNESQLKPGEEIWRKLPKLTVPNYYHAESEYIEAAQEAGLELVEEHHAMFNSEEERKKYNDSTTPDQRLGSEYVDGIGKPPFAVFVFEKAA